MGADRVVLVRHAQSEWNAEGRWQGHGGTGLTDLGRAQAATTAGFLAAVHDDVARLVGSDLQRVTETATPMTEMLGIDLREDPRWREIDVGWWSGLTSAQVAARDPERVARLGDGADVVRGGAESDADLRERVGPALIDAIDDVGGGTVVVFTHGGPIRAAVAGVLGLSVAQSRRLAGPANCSLTVVDAHGRPLRLRAYAESAHLCDDLHVGS